MSGEPGDPGFDALLGFLRDARGFDFTAYKPPSLQRRVRKRMQAVGVAGYEEYVDHLEVDPGEFEALFDTVLINVTSFFRDPEAWALLESDVLPELLERRPTGDIRVWSAGCAGGQEAFTAAMVLAELLGAAEHVRRVKVYGTDCDDQALEQARQGTFAARELEDVPARLRAKYFEPAGERFAVRKPLRRTVIFGRNNLLQDAPISRLDLLLCRNTLLYFNAEAQAGVLHHFHFALRPGGVMMLGKAEMLLSHRDAFGPVDLSQRIFRRLPAPASLRAPSGDEARAARDAALDGALQPLLVVSAAGALTFANAAARSLFGIEAGHVGRPFADLELSRSPAELRGPIADALRDRRVVTVGEIGHQGEQGPERRLEVTVTPLVSGAGAALGASVLFDDVSRYAAVEGELQRNRRDLERAYEQLRSTIDELETTNEELQSANEALQIANEELQSTNEELETMNEEIQSTNDELETINDELRARTGELDRVNDHLEAILGSIGIGVAVLDREQRVQVWNARAEELWGMRSDEAAGRHFLALDIGLPAEAVAPALRGVLSGRSPREELVIDAVNRRGSPIACTATVMPLAGSGQAVRGAVVLMAGRAPGDEPDPAPRVSPAAPP